VIARLTVPEVAAGARRSEVTVYRALEAGDLHGTQSMKGGRWTVREDCAEAWADGLRCEHQQRNVTPIRARSSA
jgi:Helix-turn-helix domain